MKINALKIGKALYALPEYILNESIYAMLREQTLSGKDADIALSQREGKRFSQERKPNWHETASESFGGNTEADNARSSLSGATALPRLEAASSYVQAASSQAACISPWTLA